MKINLAGVRTGDGWDEEMTNQGTEIKPQRRVTGDQHHPEGGTQGKVRGQ